MPIVNAYPFPSLGRVLVEVDWADTPWVTCARVVRTTVSSGFTAPLRTYINPCTALGEYEKLSGGRAIFWDTEMPFDAPFFYTTDGGTVPGANEILDNFNRTVVDSWSSTNTGQAWTFEGGGAGDYDVNGSAGTMLLNDTASARSEHLTTINALNANALVTFTTPATATVASYSVGMTLRRLDVSNRYTILATMTTAGNVDIAIFKVLGGVVTIPVATSSFTTYAPASVFNMRFEVTGNTLRMKLWVNGTTEPEAWALTTTDSSLSSGTIGLIASRAVGNTNAALTIPFDNYVVNINDNATQITASTSNLTISSNGKFWLRDPSRPCNDKQIGLLFPVTNEVCDPTAGIVFESLDVETYDANAAIINVTNARRPIPVNRQRRDAATTLRLVSKLFTDRDGLITLLTPGSALFFQGPSGYGIPDRYIAVNQVGVSRGLSNIKRQLRMFSIPYVTVDRPVNTTTGICNSRFTDQCSVYSSWTAMNAAGLTWTDIIEGAGGGVSLGFRDWINVETGFANWLAVKAKTWVQIKTGA